MTALVVLLVLVIVGLVIWDRCVREKPPTVSSAGGPTRERFRPATRATPRPGLGKAGSHPRFQGRDTAAARPAGVPAAQVNRFAPAPEPVASPAKSVARRMRSASPAAVRSPSAIGKPTASASTDPPIPAKERPMTQITAIPNPPQPRPPRGLRPSSSGRSCVLIAGAGALGKNVALDLALTGVREMRIVDGDVFEEHNRTRSPLHPRRGTYVPGSACRRPQASAGS